MAKFDNLFLDLSSTLNTLFSLAHILFDSSINLITLLRGFRETIFLAIKLNRTVVPPPFYKHGRTDESQKDDEGNLT